jgi:hypothetical protein
MGPEVVQIWTYLIGHTLVFNVQVRVFLERAQTLLLWASHSTSPILAGAGLTSHFLEI